MNCVLSKNVNINKFFVYGTLRPDIKAPWSDVVHKNPKFKLTYSKAYLCYSKLFFHKTVGYPVTIYDKNRFTRENITLGYILETDNIAEALTVLDNIEDYPNEYDRIEVSCYNVERNIEEEAFFYTINKNLLDENNMMDLKVNDYKLIVN